LTPDVSGDMEIYLCVVHNKQEQIVLASKCQIQIFRCLPNLWFFLP